jgi:hypothetical protein
VAGQIDLDEFLDPLRGDVEDREIVSDSGIVDENTGVTELLPDLNSGSVDCFGVGNITLDIEGRN